MPKINMKATADGDDRNNCCVRALADAFSLTRENAAGIAAQFGRRKNDGMWYHQYKAMIFAVAESQGKAAVRLRRDEIKEFGRTVKSFKANCGRGVYILDTNNHLLTIKHGMCDDWANDTKKRITGGWMIV